MRSDKKLVKSKHRKETERIDAPELFRQESAPSGETESYGDTAWLGLLTVCMLL